MGANNENLDEVLQTNPKEVAELKFLWVHLLEICWLTTRGTKPYF